MSLLSPPRTVGVAEVSGSHESGVQGVGTVEGIGGGVGLPTDGPLTVVQRLRRVVLRRFGPIGPS